MKVLSFGTLISVLALVLISAGAHAGATKEGVQFTVADVAADPPEKVWVSDDGVLHIRGQRVTDEFAGNLVGGGVTIRNVNLDLSTGEGHAWGTSDHTLTWRGLTGTVQGSWTAKLSEGKSYIKESSHGGGDFEGMHFRFIIVGDLVAGGAVGEGIILSTHG